MAAARERAAQRFFWPTVLGSDSTWRRTLLITGVASFLLHVLVAFRSRGPHMADEHFQILEFMSMKLGRTEVSELSWEFHERIRAWLQPALYWSGAALLEEVSGPINPFHFSTALRLTNAVFGWASSMMLSLCLVSWIPEKGRRLFALTASHGFVLVPLIHARTSSESFSATLLAGTLAVLASARPDRSDRARCDLSTAALLTVGIGAGLTFQARFQTAFALLGLGLWGLQTSARRVRYVVWTLIGFVFVNTVALGIDRWGYGTWTLPAYNNIWVNLVEGRAARFGTRPWTEYPVQFFLLLPRPLGAVLVLGTLIGWWKYPRHILTWTTLPMVLGHLLIAHKELRFLYPIVPELVVLSAMALPRSLFWRGPETAGQTSSRGHLQNGCRFSIFALLFVLNAWAFPRLGALSTQRTRYALLERIHVLLPSSRQLYVLAEDPYAWAGLKMRFLAPEGLELTSFSSFDALVAGLESRDGEVLVSSPVSHPLSTCRLLERIGSDGLFLCPSPTR